MTVDVRIVLTVRGGESPGEELRAVRRWLVAEKDFRGRVDLVEAPVVPGRLGPALDALSVLLGSSSGALVSMLVAYLRTRKGRIEVTVTRADGAQVTLNAQRVREMPPALLAEFTAEVTRTLRDVA
ncbi:effector-associated constant component EACC1 [Paractinoplanes lichenicola]|uniref:Uncharacterized protein n=1 Tax=Paractinoplanes lichenicola TaxID=2802976 RepID=A0ABS1VZB9_9ACTN|nr:hypothetical protein [Actinoplanes lichenicola]MBL7259841.1 hypothetical protein [Actinoplanes lichenicola]